MGKIFEFTSRFGGKYEIKFIKTAYMCDGSLAIVVEDMEPGSEWWESYGNLTVNIGGFFFGPHMAYLDTNNVPDLCDFVLDMGWATIVGEGRSGYCTYPLVEFSEEFIDEICEVAA